MKQLKAKTKKILGLSLGLLLLLPLGISLAQPSKFGASLGSETSPRVEQLRRPSFTQSRSLRSRQFIQGLRKLSEEIGDKIFILREEGGLIKAVLEENPNPPEEFKKFAQKAREHALKARELLREAREKVQVLRSKRNELKGAWQEGSSKELVKKLKNEVVKVRSLMRKASRELDLAIFFAEKALAVLGK